MSGILLQHVHLHVGRGIQAGQGLALVHGRVGPELGRAHTVEGLHTGLGFSTRDPSPPGGIQGCLAAQRKRDGKDEDEGVG